jgi:cyclic pyranopterin phosphate synthase
MSDDCFSAHDMADNAANAFRNAVPEGSAVVRWISATERLPDDDHGTAKKFAVSDAKGTFGIISTMSHPFCNSCNRLRLTTDGKMKNCLFSKGEADILGALRRGEDIVPLIKQCVWDKKKAQGGQFDSDFKNIDSAQLKNRSMIHIGG